MTLKLVVTAVFLAIFVESAYVANLLLDAKDDLGVILGVVGFVIIATIVIVGIHTTWRNPWRQL